MGKGDLKKETKREKLGGVAARLFPRDRQQPKAAAPGEPAENLVMPPPAHGDAAFRLSGILTLVILLLVTGFGAVLGLRVYSVLGMGSNQYKNIPLVYLGGDGTLRYTSPILEHPVTVAEGPGSTDQTTASSAITLSEDGKKLLYMNKPADGLGELWLTTLRSLKGGELTNPGQQVAEYAALGSASFAQDDKSVVYLSRDPAVPAAVLPSQEEYSLCRWTERDGQEILDTQVREIIFLDEKSICYLKSSEASALDLCLLTFAPNRKERPVIQVVDMNVYGTVSIGENNAVTYLTITDRSSLLIKRWTGKDITNLGILKVDPKQAGTQWAKFPSSQIARTMVADVGPRGETFYTQAERAKFDPDLFFADDLAVPDSLLTEPTEESFMVEKKNLWGKVTKTLDTEAYEAAQEEYADKQKRDEIRAEIAAGAYTYQTSTLCHTVGSSVTTVDSGITAIAALDAASATVIYYKERSAIAEKYPVSKLIDAQDTQRMLETIKQNTVRDYYYAKLGNEPVMFQSVTRSEQLIPLLDKDRGFYFLKGTIDLAPSGGTLYYSSMEQDGLSGAKKIDDKVLQLENIRYGDQLLYRKSSGSDMVDLYGVSAGKKTQLVTGISQQSDFYIHDQSILAYRNYHSGRQTGELVFYDGKTKPLRPETHAYGYRTPDFLYLLTDYDSVAGTGDLYLYTGNAQQLTLVDTAVSMVLNP